MLKENNNQQLNDNSRSSKSDKMRTEISLEYAGPSEYKKAMKENPRDYKGPKDYRDAVKESYHATIEDDK